MDATTAAAVLDGLHAGAKRDASLRDLVRDVEAAAVRYAQFRARWALAADADRHELDQPRRLAHEALIAACNAASRAFAKAGIDNRWREQLTDVRTEIGDFACYAACELSLSAR